MNKIDLPKNYSLKLKAVQKLLMLFAVVLLSVPLFAGTTGKISGYVTDQETGEPIVGANVIIEGTYLGASADLDGYYSIGNIPPGEYRVIFSAVGYQKTIVEKVLVKIDLTTKVDLKLNSSVIQLNQEVVVTSQRPLVQKDLTSTSVTISANEIKMMPVESIGQIVNLQAGVIDGHFRGGRSNDVAYLIDGVAVTDAFNGGFGVQVENSSVRQMEVISGTFNAEYGQALSGVVNIVTQSGSDKFEGYVTGYVGSYFTNHSDIFRNLDHPWDLAQRNLQLTLSGPISPVKNLYFFVTGRYYKNNGYLYGQRIFNVNDDIPFFPNPSDQTFWIPRNTGDGSYVSMNPERKYSANVKLSYALPELNITYSAFWDDNENRYYDHGFSLTPDAVMTHYRTNLIHNLQFNYFPTSNTFHSLKFSANFYDYKGYLYPDYPINNDPLSSDYNPYGIDPRYVNPDQGVSTSQYTFRQGGNQVGRYNRHTNTLIAQYSYSSQISKEHKIGAGIEGKYYEIYSMNKDIINLTPEETFDSLGNRILIFTPGYPDKGTITDKGSYIEYIRNPFEISAYVQDKMEYDIMIINAGIRFDYFNSNASLPADLRNPRHNGLYPGAILAYPGADSTNEDNWLLVMRKADAKFQISPRLGASFPITDQGIIRFSYGHFFKIPSFENLYANPNFIVQPGSNLSSSTGNPDLNAEKNVIYEIGLQQVLFENVSLNFSVYYRDIRNWLGMEIINTYEGFKYARFINRDYANVKGFILTLDKRFADYFGLKLDYTFQIAQGNASDPRAVFNNNQTNIPIEEAKSVVPLDWDQRHTLNVNLNVGVPGDWTVGMIFQYGSGQPYTEDPKISQGVRFENGGIKPTFYNVDLRAEKTFDVYGFSINTYLMVYNLFDIKNEFGVYSTTGRANVDLNTQNFKQSDIIGLNTIEQYINNPGMYSSPREIRLGLGFGF
ncbi:MAG TPA: TonB-dependent receptor [Ignavibacteriales bacterium]|nr:TonB-dependent receptor [Ignavibacteriales bacterium]